MSAIIHENIENLCVPIDQVHQAVNNPNANDIEPIVESIKVNGFYNPITIDQNGTILAGNHRYAAMLALGMDRIPATRVNVSEQAADRILVVDNRTTRLGQDDPALLLDILKDLQETEIGLAGTGYDEGDLDIILDQMADEGGFGGDPETTVGGTMQIVIDCDDSTVEADFRKARKLFPHARLVDAGSGV